MLRASTDQRVHHAVVPDAVRHLPAQGRGAPCVGRHPAGGIRGPAALRPLSVGQTGQVCVWWGGGGRGLGGRLCVCGGGRGEGGGVNQRRGAERVGRHPAGGLRDPAAIRPLSVGQTGQVVGGGGERDCVCVCVCVCVHVTSRA